MKIHFRDFSSSFERVLTKAYAIQPKTFKWLTLGFLPVQVSYSVRFITALVGEMFRMYTVVATTSPQNLLAMQPICFQHASGHFHHGSAPLPRFVGLFRVLLIACKCHFYFKSHKLIIQELTTRISSECLDAPATLLLHKCFKDLETLEGL